MRAFGRIQNYIVPKYKSYLRGLEVFFGGPEPWPLYQTIKILPEALPPDPLKSASCLRQLS